MGPKLIQRLIFNHHLTNRNSFAPGRLEVKLDLDFKGSTLRLRKRFQEAFFKHHLFAKREREDLGPKTQ
ncbi:hypothetical protein TNCV_1449371 [Trichonephila clavipes]|nr:hypothetical protein TNCV_1449371 [Trichonephila clavipes]